MFARPQRVWTTSKSVPSSDSSSSSSSGAASRPIWSVVRRGGPCRSPPTKRPLHLHPRHWYDTRYCDDIIVAAVRCAIQYSTLTITRSTVIILCSKRAEVNGFVEVYIIFIIRSYYTHARPVTGGFSGIVADSGATVYTVVGSVCGERATTAIAQSPIGETRLMGGGGCV